MGRRGRRRPSQTIYGGATGGTKVIKFVGGQYSETLCRKILERS